MGFKVLDLYGDIRLEGVAQAQQGLAGVKQEATATSAIFGRLEKDALALSASFNTVRELWSGLQGLAADERAFTRLSGVLRATGGAAGFSAGELKAYAKQMEDLRGTTEGSMMAAMAVLAGFKNVSSDTFMAAIESAQDLAILWGTDVPSAARVLGLALDDPINGLAALSREGIRFSDEQKNMIKSLVEGGDAAKAQAMILDELKSKMGGLAAEAAEDLQGRLDRLAASWENLKKTAAGPLTFVLEFVAKPLKLVEAMGEAWDEMMTRGPGQRGGPFSKKIVPGEQYPGIGGAKTLEEWERIHAEQAAKGIAPAGGAGIGGSVSPIKPPRKPEAPDYEAMVKEYVEDIAETEELQAIRRKEDMEAEERERRSREWSEAMYGAEWGDQARKQLLDEEEARNRAERDEWFYRAQAEQEYGERFGRDAREEQRQKEQAEAEREAGRRRSRRILEGGTMGIEQVAASIQAAAFGGGDIPSRQLTELIDIRKATQQVAKQTATPRPVTS